LVVALAAVLMETVAVVALAAIELLLELLVVAHPLNQL
jgi:hypothetical protein